MKQLFFLLAFCATITTNAQTNTFTGAINTNWNNGLNWSLNTVPGATNTVVIPTGKSVVLNANASVQSIQLEGTAALTIQANLSISETSNADALATISWGSGILSGATFNNLGAITLVAGGKKIDGGMTFNNSGTITIVSDSSLDISNGVLNNLPAGVIDFQFTQDITGTGVGTHTLNNAGTIKKSVNVGPSSILAELHNTGTISAESGTLRLSNPLTVLTGGTYNASAGSNLLWNSTVTVSGVLSGNIAGELNWAGTVNVPLAASFGFSGGGTFNWGNGRVTGGGTLVNNSLLQMTGAYFGTKIIEGGTTFNNAATIRIQTDWSIDIQNGTLNNLATGIIDFQQSHQMLGTGAGSHAFNNNGLIKITNALAVGRIDSELTNTGTIWVETGTIQLRNPQTQLNGGIYNVAAAGTLMNTQPIICSGTLTGVVDGIFTFNSDINVPVAASFNFSGNGLINWGSGTIKGGGTLTNLGVFEFSGAWVGSRFLSESTTLVNANTLKMTSDQTVTMNGATINNLVNATIDISFPGALASGTGINIVNNIGLLKKSASTGTYTIGATVNNIGSIEANVGQLKLDSFNNTLTGTVSGTGAIQVASGTNFINNGTFAPGGDPGMLTVVGNYSSTANTRFNVELYGLVPGTGYDTMTVQSQADMAGILNVDLYFDPAINDQFTIATSWTTLTSSLPTTVVANYNGMSYTFNVNVVTNNKLVLTLVQKVLASDSFAIESKKITMAPNPATTTIRLRNESQLTLTQATLLDLNGRTIRRVDLTNFGKEFEIALDHFAAGQYFIRLQSDRGSMTRKFSVK